MAGEEPQAGVRSPEWSRAGAGSGVRGRKGHLEVPAPLGRAWGLPRSPALGPRGQRGRIGWYPDPVLCVQEGVLTRDEALSIRDGVLSPLPCPRGAWPPEGAHWRPRRAAVGEAEAQGVGAGGPHPRPPGGRRPHVFTLSPEPQTP